MTRGHRWLSALIVAFATLASAGSRGDEAHHADAQAEQDGITHYEAARKLYDRGDRARALEEIEASLKALPSPNSELLRAHLLRELGRNAEAMRAYERAVDGSVARLRAGEQRFEPTAAEAGRWIALLRASLAELTVVVPAAPVGTAVTIDGAPVEIAAHNTDSDLDLRVWHDPGDAVVMVRPPGRPVRTRSVALTAGASVRLVLELGDRPPPVVEAPAPTQSTAPVPPPRPSRIPPPPPASWILGGIGVVGLGSFAVFGSMAASTENDLEQCSPRCAEALRGEADAGKRNQVIADVSLGVGIVSIATAVVIWLAAPQPARPSHTPARASARPAGPWRDFSNTPSP